MNRSILSSASALLVGFTPFASMSQTQAEIKKACDNLYQMQMMGMNTGAIVQGIMFTGTDKAKKELLAMRRVCPDAMQHTTPRF
jgi:hypothetical protein